MHGGLCEEQCSVTHAHCAALPRESVEIILAGFLVRALCGDSHSS